METEHSIAFLDGYPVSEGHALVIPKRHAPILHDLPANELNDVWALVAKVRGLLKEKHNPDGVNIGVNEGEVAGQAILHAHVHIISQTRRRARQPDVEREMGDQVPFAPVKRARTTVRC